jgi:hypothetical protein
MVTRYQRLFIALAICIASVFALTAHAQFSNFPGFGSALSITFFPTSPSPGDTLNLTVQSPLIDIPESTILWQAGGKTIAQGKGVDSASVQLGALGSETRIDVTVTTADGDAASTQATIVPTELDVLVDSDSYTPPFYRGRARASAGTNLRLQALPRFKRAGALLPAPELIYTWRRNDQVLGNISGRGKSAVVIPVEHLFGTDTISVEVRSADGSLAHTASFPVSASEPVLLLYENHPLYGILYHRALTNSAFIPETEMTFAAVPFFVQAGSVHDRALSFDWQVNAASITPGRSNPDEVTINAENSSGIAFIELAITHATNYYLDVKDAWNITFSSQGDSGTDQFHPSNTIRQ